MGENEQIETYTLNLTLDQINFILGTVGKLPYETVANFVNTIHSQIGPQIRAQEALVSPEQTEQAEAEPVLQ